MYLKVEVVMVETARRLCTPANLGAGDRGFIAARMSDWVADVANRINSGRNCDRLEAMLLCVSVDVKWVNRRKQQITPCTLYHARPKASSSKCGFCLLELTEINMIA